jgi:hypothetical protein
MSDFDKKGRMMKFQILSIKKTPVASAETFFIKVPVNYY